MSQNISILVVDDDPQWLHSLSHVLGGASYEVRQAASGENALASLAADGAPDLILLDIRMPDIDGFEVFRRIRAHEEFFGIPIIMLSGVVEAKERAAGIEMGASDFITKPFDPGELLARVRMQLEMARLRVGLQAVNESLREEIATRVRADEDLLREKEFSRLVLENIEAGVVVCDETGKLILFNRIAREWHGLDPMGIPQSEWALKYDLFFPDGVTPLPAEMIPLVRAFRGETLKDTDMIIAAKGQPVRHVLCSGSLILDAEGNVAGAAMVMNDITERKAAEAALRRSEEEFHALAESMPQIVWATRPDGWNIYFNHQWVDYTGLSLEESWGHGWNKPFHPDDQQRAWDAWQQATQHNDTCSLECRLRRADGTYRWFLIRGVPLLSMQTGRF